MNQDKWCHKNARGTCLHIETDKRDSSYMSSVEEFLNV